MGENITTSGIDLLSLPTGTVLQIGVEAEVEITGLRNPCNQIEAWQPGLLKELVFKGEDGALVRKAGIMGIVLKGGTVKPGDDIRVMLPAKPWRKSACRRYLRKDGTRSGGNPSCQSRAGGR
jgi:MOSC domain-containing protein YiiM